MNGYLQATVTYELTYGAHTIEPAIWQAEIRNGTLYVADLPFITDDGMAGGITMQDVDSWHPWEPHPNTGCLVFDHQVFYNRNGLAFMENDEKKWVRTPHEDLTKNDIADLKMSYSLSS